jgi:hypothetical protein
MPLSLTQKRFLRIFRGQEAVQLECSGQGLGNDDMDGEILELSFTEMSSA